MAKKSKEHQIRAALTKSQQLAFDLYLSGQNLFITGKGGTGKSFLLRKIIEDLKMTKKEVLVCAPTGIAALNIGGATIHRTFRASTKIVMPDEELRPRKPLDPDNKAYPYNRKRNDFPDPYEVILKADVIIIDEISMCRMDVFGYVARTILHCPRPKQVILVGDFYQLPPVLTDKNKEQDAWQEVPEYCNKLYAFEAPEWQHLKITTVELTENMRQKDKDFVSALDLIREGKPSFGVFSQNQASDPMAITLCPTNIQAGNRNEYELQKAISRTRKFKIYSELRRGFTGLEEEDIDKYRVTVKALKLCPGARVILLHNDNNAGYVNGDTGVIEELQDNSILVMLDSGKIVLVERYTWQASEYRIVEKVDQKTGKKKKVLDLVSIGEIMQIPVKLAWAISVHKSQGQTYDKCNVVCGFWAKGQMYVALSRCRSLAGLRIVGQLKEEELKCSQEVLDFMSNLNNVTEFNEPEFSSTTMENNVTKTIKEENSDISNEVVKNVTEIKSIRKPKGAGRKPKPEELKTKPLRVTDDEKAIILAIRQSTSIYQKVKVLCRLVKSSFIG